MPYVSVRKVRGKFRLVEKGTSRVARNERGTVRDGGGHGSGAKASRQSRAVNEGIRKKYEND